ncbi:hypothetical protein J3D46_002960 [Paenarthrobacter sp. A20]|nr:hypothetical protein [Paenarthrobacter sp. A20]
MARPGIAFESHLGHCVVAGQGPIWPLTVYKTPKSVYSGVAFYAWPASLNDPKTLFDIRVVASPGRGGAAVIF